MTIFDNYAFAAAGLAGARPQPDREYEKVNVRDFAPVGARGTITTASSSTTVNVSLASGTPMAGQSITGDGIPAGTTISSVSGSTLTLSAAVGVAASTSFYTYITLGIGKSQPLSAIFGNSAAGLAAAIAAYPYAAIGLNSQAAELAREIDEVVITNTAALLTLKGGPGLLNLRPSYVFCPPGQYYSTQTIYLDLPTYQQQASAVVASGSSVIPLSSVANLASKQGIIGQGIPTAAQVYIFNSKAYLVDPTGITFNNGVKGTTAAASNATTISLNYVDVLTVGLAMTGVGIPDGTTITAIAANSTGGIGGGPGTVTLSQPVTVANAQSVYFYKPAVTTADIPSGQWLFFGNNVRCGNPSNPQFSSGLIGVGNGGNSGGAGQGTNIRPLNNSYIALYLGAGRRQTLSQIAVRPRNRVLNDMTQDYSGYRGLQHSGGLAFAVSGFASNTLFDRLYCDNHYRCVALDAQPTNNLADSNTFYKCYFNNGAIGIDVRGNQAFINHVIDCTIGCTVAFNDPTNRSIIVDGGDLSCTGTLIKSYAPQSLSSFTSANYNSEPTQQFTFVAQPSATYDAAYLANGVITIGAVQTASYGTIPFAITGFNTSTNVVTCVLYPTWYNHTFCSMAPSSALLSDINAEMAAAAKLYVGERAIVFNGGISHGRGFHLENPSSVTTLCNAIVGYGNGGECFSSFENFLDDADITQAGYATSTSDSFGYYLLQSVFGFVEIPKGGATVRVARAAAATTLGGGGASQALVDVHSGSRFISEQFNWGQNLNVRAGVSGGFIDDGSALSQATAATTLVSPSQGAGEFDITPFKDRLGSGSNPSAAVAKRTTGAGANRYRGNFPDQRENSILHPADFAVLTASGSGSTSGPAAATALGSYPIVYGGQQYLVTNRYSKSLPARYAAPIFGGTYGKNITLTSTWQYKAGGNVVKFNGGAADMKWAVAGLVIGLDPTNSGTYTLYFINGVYPVEGYITVTYVSGQPGAIYNKATLVGTDAQLYSGSTANFSTIYQQPCGLTAN